MAMLERIVRPALPEDIRPAIVLPARQEETDPDQGAFILTGGSGNFITTSHSRSSSSSKNKEQELSRTYDKVRVFDPNNRDNHVDMNVTTKLRTANGQGAVSDLQLTATQEFLKDQQDQNVELLSAGNEFRNDQAAQIRERQG